MNNEEKKKYYSIAFLVSLVLLINSIPFSLLITNELLLFAIDLIIKTASIFYIIRYIKKDNLNKLKFTELKKGTIKLLPLSLLFMSNFIVIMFQQTPLNTTIDYFDIFTKIILAIGVSVIEELLFRGQIMEEFLKKQKPVKAILYSSMIFGGVHLLNISSIGTIPTVLAQVGYTAFLGLILGYIYYKSNNIIVPIAFHFLFNTFNDIIVTELFSLKWDLTFFIVNISIGIIVLLYILLSIKKEGTYASTNLDN